MIKPMPMTIWIAHLETSNFTFDAVGPTQSAALTALRKGWAAHRRQYKARAGADFFRWPELVEDVYTIEVPFPGAVRDMDHVL